MEELPSQVDLGMTAVPWGLPHCPAATGTAQCNFFSSWHKMQAHHHLLNPQDLLQESVANDVIYIMGARAHTRAHTHTHSNYP